MSATPAPAPCHIGVFDSGVGGLSVLRALRVAMPGARFSYLADSAHAPYGEKSESQVQARSLAVARWLHDAGAQLLVVACNTATALAIEPLRHLHAHWPIVGVEPGVKPALAASACGHVAVLATPGTLASERFARLLRNQAGTARVHALPCPGLAAAIESGNPQALGLDTLLDDIGRRVQATGADQVVLGCTHYPFVADGLRQRLGPQVQLVDTADAVARRVLHLLPQARRLPAESGSLQLFTTGEPHTLERLAQRWLGHTQPALQAEP
ncbi:glutamate racemase [Burkholderiales bacterium JOSHI_001]|nr:glutamate racemase [Burkholderiales bacterium JOSHI_001]